MSSSMLVAVVTVAALIYGGLHFILHLTQDAREPPPVPSSLPFIKPMIDLSRKKSKYYTEIWDRCKLPACTIRLPGARLYIINATSLIPSVQRQYKTLAFPPLEAKLAENVCGPSKTASDILNTNVNGDEGPWGYSITHYKAIHPPLFPGPGLDAMNRVMARKIASSLECVQSTQSIRLFDFIKHEITLATTESVYGDQNPFRDPVIVERFWEFQEGIMGLLMGLPTFFVRESFKAREFMTQRFVKYFEAGGHKTGSALIKARYDHSIEHKIPVEDIARFETAGAIAILTNTSPACFWLVYHLYSSPTALEDCRKELTSILSSTAPGEASHKTITLDLTHVKTSCPTLLSSLQEVLRLHSVGISTRLVMQDHLLDGKYLLKKGGTVMIPAPVQHQDAATWGANVRSFDHRRFMPGNMKRANPVAFRGFGGGTTLCPGRHFASTEIFAFAALMILRFDVRPEGGSWKELTTEKASLWEVTPRPDEDIVVNLVPRDEFGEDVKWKVLVSDSDKGIALAAEDIEALGQPALFK